MWPSWSRHWPTVRSSGACALRNCIKAICWTGSVSTKRHSRTGGSSSGSAAERTLDALAGLLREQLHAARPEPAIQTALRLLSMDPLQEAVHRDLMTLLPRQGRRAAALQQYQVCVATLERELPSSLRKRRANCTGRSCGPRVPGGLDRRDEPGSHRARFHDVCECRTGTVDRARG